MILVTSFRWDSKEGVRSNSTPKFLSFYLPTYQHIMLWPSIFKLRFWNKWWSTEDPVTMKLALSVLRSRKVVKMFFLRLSKQKQVAGSYCFPFITVSFSFRPFSGSADPFLLHQVWAVPEASCVAQEDREAPDVERRLHYVPGGSSDGRHNGCRSVA